MCSGRLSRMKWRCGMWTILKETLNGARRHIDVTLDGDCRPDERGATTVFGTFRRNML